MLVTKAAESDSVWTQINPPDTNTDTSVDSLNFEVVTPTSGDTELKVNYTLIQKNTDLTTGSPLESPANITGSFVIKGSDLGAIVTNIELDVVTSVDKE
jgi:hypothetical protein